MERVSLTELRRRLTAYALAPEPPDENVDLAATALAGGRKLRAASLSLHPDPGVGAPAFLLRLEGPGGPESLLVAAGPRAFELLARHLGAEGAVETDVLPVAAEGAFARLRALAPPPREASPARAAAVAEEEEEERVFARIVCAANPAAAGELLRGTIDVLLEEVDGERGIVAVAREGALVPEVARLAGGRDLGDAVDEVPRRVFEKVAASRRAVFVEDVLDPTLSLLPSESLLGKRVQSFLAAPLLAQGEVTGVLYVDRRDRRTRFDARARRLFERLAARVASLAAAALEARGSAEDLDEAGPEGLLDLVGGSRPMRALFREIRRVAGQDVDVLVLGETGTGKELVARAVHCLGRRRERRFEALNCAALPETLLDSVLFGHVRGAFTGADRDRAGLFVEASGGTLFLDEVGDMPAALQAKLLRTLELGEVRPVGASRAVQADVRVVAATHRDLAAMAASGAFRSDLYYRLTAAETLRLPPLRDRVEDVAPLARHFLRLAADRHGVPARRFAPAALERLAAHPWPGNVRELRNVVLHTARRCPDELVAPGQLVFGGAAPQGASPGAPAGGLPATAAEVRPLREHVRAYLARVHELADGNVTRMAELLDEPRTTVRDRLREHGIVRQEPKKRR